MITFRELEVSDLQTLLKIRNDCVDFLHDSRKFNLDQAISWFSTLETPYYAVLLHDIMIGYYRTSNYSKNNRSIYVGMDIEKKFRGNGYAFKAYKKLLPYTFKTFNLNKISLEVLSTNLVAINLYKKLGFIQEGIKRQEIYKNNNYVDSILMSLLKTEYEEASKQYCDCTGCGCKR